MYNSWVNAFFRFCFFVEWAELKRGGGGIFGGITELAHLMGRAYARGGTSISRLSCMGLFFVLFAALLCMGGVFGFFLFVFVDFLPDRFFFGGHLGLGDV